MPKFAPEEVKTAVAPITVKPAGLDCRTELYLVSNGAKVATSGIKSFISTGARQNISFPITMPAPGTYAVYLDVAAQGVLIAAYQAIEDVVIEALMADIRVENLTIEPAEIFVEEKVTISCRATNYGAAAGEYTIKLGGDVVAEQSVTLQPGEAKTVTFEAIPHEAKTYQVSVNGLAGSFRAKALVGECNLEPITITPERPLVLERTVVNVRIVNWSGVTAPYHIEIHIIAPFDIYVDGLLIHLGDGTLSHGGGSSRGAGFRPRRAAIYTARVDLDYGREVLTKDFEVFIEPEFKFYLKVTNVPPEATYWQCSWMFKGGMRGIGWFTPSQIATIKDVVPLGKFQIRLYTHLYGEELARYFTPEFTAEDRATYTFNFAAGILE